jgi:hypothetical protein
MAHMIEFEKSGVLILASMKTSVPSILHILSKLYIIYLVHTGCMHICILIGESYCVVKNLVVQQ